MRKKVRKLQLNKQTVQLLSQKQKGSLEGGTGTATCETIDCSMVCSYITICWWCRAEKRGPVKD
jgi:hypothetical protein